MIMSKKATVVNLHKEKFDVFIGRPSKWGNPFSHRKDTRARFQVASREEAIEKFREWVVKQPHLMLSLGELRGKVLGCFCKPEDCHGDVLAEIVNDKFGDSSTKD
jgi:hypothetical protein